MLVSVGMEDYMDIGSGVSSAYTNYLSSQATASRLDGQIRKKDDSLVDFFKDNALQELASTSTERDGLGLAQMLYEQMKRNYNL